MTDDDTCPCCLGPAGLVCDACGTHDCWAGIWMCIEAYGAGVCTAAEYAERHRETAT